MGAMCCCQVLKRGKPSRCNSCCQARWGESTWFITVTRERLLTSCRPAGPAQHKCDSPMSYRLKQKNKLSTVWGIWGWSFQQPSKACSMEVRSLFHTNSCFLSLFISEDCCQEQFMISWPQCKKNCIFQKRSMKFLWLFIDTAIRH